MKKLISILLVIAMLLASTGAVFADIWKPGTRGEHSDSGGPIAQGKYPSFS